MFKALSCAAVLLSVPLTLLAQEAPQVEVFAGYSYLLASDSFSERVNQNGWNSSLLPISLDLLASWLISVTTTEPDRAFSPRSAAEEKGSRFFSAHNTRTEERPR